MKRFAAVILALTVLCAGPASAQVLHTEDTQASLDIRLIEASLFCINWANGRGKWNPESLGMEDYDGAPTAAKPGEAWDETHDSDLSIIALEPHNNGCKVLMHTDKWDKAKSANLILGWLLKVRGHTVFSSVTNEDPAVITLSDASGPAVIIRRYRTRPADDAVDAGTDLSLFFFHKD